MHYRRAPRRDLVSRRDIAAMAGVADRTVDMWVDRTRRAAEDGAPLDVPFPQEVRRVGAKQTRMYDRAEVEAYLLRRGLVTAGIADVAAMLGITEARTFELHRLGGLPAPSFHEGGEPRWHYPELRSLLFSDEGTRAFLLGECDLDTWLAALHRTQTTPEA